MFTCTARTGRTILHASIRKKRDDLGGGARNHWSRAPRECRPAWGRTVVLIVVVLAVLAAKVEWLNVVVHAGGFLLDLLSR